jgi:hypothetical protein
MILCDVCGVSVGLLAAGKNFGVSQSREESKRTQRLEKTHSFNNVGARALVCESEKSHTTLYLLMSFSFSCFLSQHFNIHNAHPHIILIHQSTHPPIHRPTTHTTLQSNKSKVHRVTSELRGGGSGGSGGAAVHTVKLVDVETALKVCGEPLDPDEVS